MIDTIIFDCDGTLSRSDAAYYHGFCDALTKYGFKPPAPDEYQALYSGKIIRDIIRLYGEKAGTPLPPEVEAHYWTLEMPYLDQHTGPVEGAAEAVDRLQKRFSTCVASNASVALVQYLLRAAGLIEKFPLNHIFSSEHVERPKPAPDVFLYALALMKASPGKTVIIEDSYGGVRAGVAAGIRVIGFAGTSHDIEAKLTGLEDAGAVASFATWPEIVSYIESL
jgi:beta-phosphoglucomutase-like phosphatase (HAD superfamily)